MFVVTVHITFILHRFFSHTHTRTHAHPQHRRHRHRSLAHQGLGPEARQCFFALLRHPACALVARRKGTNKGRHQNVCVFKCGCVCLRGSLVPLNRLPPLPIGSLQELTGATEGLLAIKSPWPSTIRSIHGDHERMEQTYFSFEGYYLTGDNAR